MELTHLRYFVAVAEELHFGKAARRLRISQPPLSQQIKKLEDELNLKLFNRSSRVVALTEAGRLMLDEARAVLSRVDLLEERMALIGGGKGGLLSIGFNEPALNTVLPRAVDRFRRKYPKVGLQLHEMESTRQLRALRGREIHLGLMRPYGFDLSGLRSRRLYSEDYVLALPKKHRLSRKKRVALNDLAGEDIILFARRTNPVLHRTILDILRGHGLRAAIRQEAGNKGTILALAGAGLGVGIVPESSAAAAPAGVLFRPLAPGLPPVEIVAVWREDDERPALRHFLDLLDSGP